MSPTTTTGDRRWKQTQERTGPHNNLAGEEPEGLIMKIRSWEHCFNDNCNEHRWEKVEAGYYPRQVGEKGELSKNDRREHKKRRAVRTRLGGEGSEKTVPDVEAMEAQISDLRSQLDSTAQTIVANDKDLERLDKEKEKVQQAYNRTKQRIYQIGAMLWKEGDYMMTQ